MLIKVTVENFKSFSEPTEMTMISSTKIQKGTDKPSEFYGRSARFRFGVRHGNPSSFN